MGPCESRNTPPSLRLASPLKVMEAQELQVEGSGSRRPRAAGGEADGEKLRHCLHPLIFPFGRFEFLHREIS